MGLGGGGGGRADRTSGGEIFVAVVVSCSSLKSRSQATATNLRLILLQLLLIKYILDIELLLGAVIRVHRLELRIAHHILRGFIRHPPLLLPPCQVEPRHAALPVGLVLTIDEHQLRALDHEIGLLLVPAADGEGGGGGEDVLEELLELDLQLLSLGAVVLGELSRGGFLEVVEVGFDEELYLLVGGDGHVLD